MFGVQQDCSSSSVKCPEESGSMERKPRGSSETSEKLSDFEFEQVFQPECTVILDRSMDRLAVIKTLVEKLAQQGQIDSQHARCIVRNLVDQDRRCSSVTQEGFAFPHLVTPVISKTVGAIGFAPKGISMTTPSSCSVRLVVLTVSPFPRPGFTSDWHLQLQRWLMSQLSGLFSHPLLSNNQNSLPQFPDASVCQRVLAAIEQCRRTSDIGAI